MIPEKQSFTYVGLSKNLITHFQKCVFYSFENSKVNILHLQKNLYFFLLTLFILYFIYSWNYLFTYGAWDSSPYFIPNINTIIWLSLGFSDLSIRGIWLPLKRKEEFSYLFPVNWIFIAIVGVIIDLIKIPGRVFGAYKLIRSSDQGL